MQELTNKAMNEDQDEFPSEYKSRDAWEEFPEETYQRRSWSIEEEKFKKKIKKIHLSVSVSVVFLKSVFLLTLLVLAYMISIGTPASTIIAGMATLMGVGGTPGLAYRYFDKRRQDAVNREKSTPITPCPPIVNSPKPLPGEED